MKQRIGIGFLILALIFGASSSLAVPNKVWLVPGTPLRFGDSGQSGVTASTTLTLTGLGAGAGQYSARYDKNALVSPSGALPYVWRWGCTVTLSGTPSATGDAVEVYIGTSDGTIAQGGLGTTTAALASDLRKNLTFVGVIIVDKTSANPVLQGAGDAEIKPRYFSVALFNTTALAFTASTSAHTCYLTPYSVEIQANAQPLDYDNRTAVPALALAA